LLDVLRARPAEAVSIAWIDDDTDREALSVLMPHVREMRAPGDNPTVFVCFDRACREPVSDPEVLGKLLDEAFEPPVEGFS